MKAKLGYIKGFVLLALTFFLFAFAKNRNSARQIGEIKLHFTNSENLYITEEAVNKLLIQTEIHGRTLGEEILDLSRVEAVLDSNAMVENAEVFLTINGNLGATITQRKPIARVMNGSSYYLDRQGLPMPLSDYHSARVPLVVGVDQTELPEVFPVVDYIIKDDFLSHHITVVRRLSDGSVGFSLRELDFVVHLGKVEDIKRKFNNFKAFYQKAMQDNKLKLYKKVDLQFGNQVVCTKK